MSQAKPTHTTLHDFADLKRALKKASREAAAQAAREREERLKREEAERATQQEREMFKQAVGAVHSLPSTGRVVVSRPRPAPLPRSREQDEAMALQESLSDEFDVDSLLETDAALAWRRPGIGPDVLRKLRRGVWTLQAQIDLHGARTDEAREMLGNFMREAQQKGWRCVRVVHGKGLGSPGRQPVLRDKVRRWLVQSDRVLAFVQARADEGGAGALVVLLAPLTRGKPGA